MEVREVLCKTALSKTSLPGLDYSLNPFRGCQFGCVYCYSPAVLHEGREWGGFVDVKVNVPQVLRRELRKRPRGVVGLGTVTDPYQPLERKHELTRRCLEELDRADLPVSVQTKSSLVTRDLELLREMTRADLGFSMCLLKEEHRKVFEPLASPVADRLRALEEATSLGLKTWVFLGPLLPIVTEEDLEELVEAVAATGVRNALVDKLNLKRGTWAAIMDRLGEVNPSLQEKYAGCTWDRAYYAGVEARTRDLLERAGLAYVPAWG
jgi:DNA repair photolyase